uniref:Uncharacterized protein n=1 Tax=Anopheles stephensi TaxID=30069 RepID=A0A182YRP6_ANOST
MKCLIVLAALIAIAAAAPQGDIEVRNLDIDHSGLVDGSYSFSYDQSDDHKREESAMPFPYRGTLKTAAKE